MNIAEWLLRTAQRAPDRPALFLGKTCIADYAQFHRRAGQVAAWLGAQGVASGDRVALFLANHPDFLLLLYGIWYAGAAAVPVNAKLHAREAEFILANSQASICFTHANLQQTDCAITAPEASFWLDIDTFAPVPAPVERTPSDLAWLFYTSGTTGQPKGVMITHRMLMTVSLTYGVDVDEPRPEDAVLYAAPMSHGAGLYAMLHVLQGARHVCPASGGFEPAEIFDLARHHREIQMFAAPTMVKRLTEAARASGQTGDGLRTVVYAGGPMYMADILEAVEVFGPVFVQIYGQGECPMGITALPRSDVADRTRPRWQERLASVGRAQSTVQIQVGDKNGAPLPSGEVGEIMVKGDPVMPGYWCNADATERTFRNGWLMTGDMGALDDEGYLTLHDRSKDLIITGGSNVYPREVEEVLLTHPKVTEISVIGRPHPEWGEEIVAFVVGDATPEELDQLCLDQIARFKRPKAYVYVDALPKNNYGKVLKTELRAKLADRT